MLAQSLFALTSPPAASLAGESASDQDAGVAFGRLVDQATRPVEPSVQAVPPAAAAAPDTPSRPPVLSASPNLGLSTTLAETQGPQILPAEPPPPPAKPLDGQGPQILPATPDAGVPEKAATHERPQVNPGADPALPAHKPSGPPRPQVLPGAPDEGPASAVFAKPDETGPQILPGEAEPNVPPPAPAKSTGAEDTARPEVLPIEVGPASVHPAPATAERPTPIAPAEVASHPGGSAPAPLRPLPAAQAEVPSASTPETKAETPVAAPEQPAPVARLVQPAPSATPAAPPTLTEAPVARSEGAAGLPAEAAPAAEGAAPSAEAPAFSLSRVAHETLAELSAQIVRRLEGRSTRFEMALTPDDLGRVDVSLEVGEDGTLTARLAFDTPAAMAEMRWRADELRRQLEQAGFQLSREALEFSQRDGSSGRHDGFERRSNRAFAAARDLAERTQAATLIALSLSLNPARDRVDVKV